MDEKNNVEKSIMQAYALFIKKSAYKNEKLYFQTQFSLPIYLDLYFLQDLNYLNPNKKQKNISGKLIFENEPHEIYGYIDGILLDLRIEFPMRSIKDLSKNLRYIGEIQNNDFVGLISTNTIYSADYLLSDKTLFNSLVGEFILIPTAKIWKKEQENPLYNN